MTGELIDDENWLDMRIGERGTVKGTYGGHGYGHPAHLLVTLATWAQLAIELEHPDALTVLKRDTGRITVRVERTEDGLSAVWVQPDGGVVIPCVGVA